MSDGEGETSPSEDEQRLVREIDKEINMLKYFLEETGELFELGDFAEIDIANKRAEKIIAKLSEELKIERGVTSRSVRLWKKDTKSKYAAFVIDKERLGKCLSEKEEEIERRKEDSKREQQMEDERRLDYASSVKDNRTTSVSYGRKSSKQNCG
ncbi:hypothetical protein ACROYT_G029107 [Oculina patagonica]